MAITVQHGPASFGNAGEIMSRAVQGELERANQRSMQMKELMNRGAIASAQIQMDYEKAHEANQTAIKTTALKAGLAKDMQMQEYLQSLNQAKEAGKQAASNTEFRFTTAQRIEDAKYAKAERLIQNSDQYTQEEKDAALQRIALARAGISKPTEVLGDPNKPTYPEGKEPGQLWQGENGGWFSTNPDQTVKLQIRPDQTPEYQDQKQKGDLAIKQENWKFEQQKQLFDIRSKLETTQVEEIVNDEKRKRFLTDEEIEAKLARIEGREPRQKSSEDKWWEPLQQQGWQVTQDDVDLPKEIGGSQAYIRTMNAQYGGFEGIPDEFKPAYISAARALAQYRQRVPGKEQQKKPLSRGKSLSRPMNTAGTEYWFHGG